MATKGKVRSVQFVGGVLFPERVQDMPTTAVVEAVIVLREELRPPKYGTQLNEDASRTFHTQILGV